MKKLLLIAALACAVLTGCTKEKPVTETPVETETEAETEVPTESQTREQETEETEIPTIEAFPNPAETTAVEPPRVAREDRSESRIVVASDVHYLAKELTDFGESFTRMVEHGDGKVVSYIWEITDAFIAEVKKERPDLLILSGDLTLNGEKKSHLELAKKLKEIKNAGIPVIVIPGNHDINNTQASAFAGAEVVPVDHITPEEFAEIYQEFGYSEAVSRDAHSLSYIYQVDDYTRAMMLDTCQYEPYNQVGGMIQEETYDWIEEQTEAAWEMGMNVIPVGHHNLLDESEVYVKDCTIEHSEQLIEQLHSWDVPLFLSGHLHVQHFMRAEEDSGIYEIVTSSLATPPCQYGILDYHSDGSFRYHTRALDMVTWTKAQEKQDKNLLRFPEYGEAFVSRVFYNQAQDEFASLDSFKNLTKWQREQMAKVYAELNSACYAGKTVEIKEKAMKKVGYQLWLEHGYPSVLGQYLESITRDGTRDYNTLEVQ